MKKQFHTKEGVTERELTQKEIIEYAKLGDMEAKTEIAKQELTTADTLKKEINVIKKLLGLI